MILTFNYIKVTMGKHTLNHSYEKRIQSQLKSLKWQKFHLDPWLLLGLIGLCIFGFLVLYSASGEQSQIIKHQGIWLCLSILTLFIFAQVPPHRYFSWAPIVYGASILLLLIVLIMGHISQGAQRWLSLGFFHFQPSEILLISTPLMVARYICKKNIPPSPKTIIISSLIIIVPFFLTAKQPDLGTAILIALSGFSVLLFAGISWKYIISATTSLCLSAPILWHFLHHYQKKRIITFLYPERDPLGSGYHIIQSKIAVGSGGFWGKGWMMGTQSHLQFLPAHTTDFIFAVLGEEFGFTGILLLLLILSLIIFRSLDISFQARNSFCRLLAGSLSLSFFYMCFINMAMVVGLVPVVGVPLPFVSYGGSSMLTLGIVFGMIMSIHTNQRLLDN